MKKVLIALLAVAVIGTMCSCSNQAKEELSNGTPESSNVGDWYFSDMEWVDDLKVSMPPYEFTELHYGIMQYDCEWNGGSAILYSVPLTKYIYGGGGGGKDYDSIVVTNEEDAFDKSIWAFEMVVANKDKIVDPVYEVKKAEVTAMRFNENDVTKVTFSMFNKNYTAFIHITSGNNDDGMFIVEDKDAEMLQAILETMVYTY